MLGMTVGRISGFDNGRKVIGHLDWARIAPRAPSGHMQLMLDRPRAFVQARGHE